MKTFYIAEQIRKTLQKEYYLLKEGIREELPSSVQKAIKKVEDNYGVKITDEHLRAERNQEKVDYYEDNGGLNSKAKQQLKKLLSALYSEFSNAPKPTRDNCDNIPGCVSGYRGYSTQASVFGGKIKNGDVARRQKVSAIPGFSQHHTGKAFDIIDLDDPYWEQNPKVKKWVENNVGKFGFKVSYPTQGTLRSPEPWHIFYVGGESSDDEIKQEKNEKIEKKVDDYYSSDKNNPEIEKKIEKRYEMAGCSPKREYTDAPSLNDVKSDSKVVIRIGHRGNSVEEIQKKLVDSGYDIGKCGPDGLFGPKTKKALEKFQEDNGLDVSSAVNKETLDKLQKPTEEVKTDKNTKDSKTKDSKSDVKVSKTTDDQYIIIRPNGYTGNRVHAFFGGHSTNPSYSKDGANMSAMKKYVSILTPYAINSIIVITHHMNTLGNVQKYVSEKFGGQVVSIAGFSQGGKETWRHADDSSLSLVGLVDPSTYKTGLPFGSNTILYCDPKNWGTSGFYGETRKRLEWYCSNKEQYGDKVVCFKKGGSHMNFGILKDFYSKYGNKI